jgi:hypothetical protein
LARSLIFCASTFANDESSASRRQVLVPLAGVEGVSPDRKLNGLEWQPGSSAHIGAKRLFDGLATRPSLLSAQHPANALDAFAQA